MCLPPVGLLTSIGRVNWQWIVERHFGFLRGGVVSALAGANQVYQLSFSPGITSVDFYQVFVFCPIGLPWLTLFPSNPDTIRFPNARVFSFYFNSVNFYLLVFIDYGY